MSDRTLRFLIAAVISMLLIFQTGTLISNVFGVAWGVATSVIVAVVSFFFCASGKSRGQEFLLIFCCQPFCSQLAP